MVLKGVNFALKFPMVLKESQCIVLHTFLPLVLAVLSRLYGARGEVASTSAERLDVSPLSTSLGLMKVGSYLCLLMPSGEVSPKSGSTDDSLDEYNNDGGENNGDLMVRSAAGGDGGGV